MIDSQRARHLWMWAILGPLAIAVFIVALLYRQEPALETDDRGPTPQPELRTGDGSQG